MPLAGKRNSILIFGMLITCLFYLDLKIVILTIKEVFISEGIVGAGSATMEKFKGNV